MSNNSMIAYCGLDCGKCPAYVATVNNDISLRDKTADEWRATFSPDIRNEDVNCLGCRSDILFGHCQVCEIRSCNQSKVSNLQNCGACSDYTSCKKISEFHKAVPEAKSNLE